MAGSITANNVVRILQISQFSQEALEILSPNVVVYTQAAAGLAIACGGLGCFLLVSMILSIANFRQGRVGLLLIAAVSMISHACTMCTVVLKILDGFYIVS